jgi:hypothetical protein
MPSVAVMYEDFCSVVSNDIEKGSLKAERSVARDEFTVALPYSP